MKEEQVRNEDKIGGMNMIKNMKKRIKNEKGLTLVEVLAVIVILGIVMAIAIPAIGNIIANSKYNAIKADGLNVINAAQLYYLDNPEETDPVKVSKLKGDGSDESSVYLESQGSIDGEATVSVTTPHTLNGKAENKGVTVNFNNASIEDINDDKQKGSDKESKTIPETATTPTPGG